MTEHEALYLRMVRKAALQHGTCEKRQIGAVLRALSGVTVVAGNTAPHGMPTCLDEGCLLVAGHCVRTVHAEVGVILRAYRAGVTVRGSTLYLDYPPCIACANVIIESGVARVVYAQDSWNKRPLNQGLRVLRPTDVIIHQCTPDGE